MKILGTGVLAVLTASTPDFEKYLKRELGFEECLTHSKKSFEDVYELSPELYSNVELSEEDKKDVMEVERRFVKILSEERFNSSDIVELSSKRELEYHGIEGWKKDFNNFFYQFNLEEYKPTKINYGVPGTSKAGVSIQFNSTLRHRDCTLYHGQTSIWMIEEEDGKWKIYKTPPFLSH